MMSITHTYYFSDEVVSKIVVELNELEGEEKLTLQLVKSKLYLFEYLFRKEVVEDMSQGKVREVYNAGKFSELKDVIKRVTEI